MSKRNDWQAYGRRHTIKAIFGSMLAGAVLLAGSVSADGQALSETKSALSPVSSVAPGVSSIHFPLTPSSVAAVPGLRIGPLPDKVSSSRLPAPMATGAKPALQASDYVGCGTAADTPPQEITDLALALQAGSTSAGWVNIFQCVHNKIDLEPTAESTKGAYGTYLDQSGSSFDQASLLVALLRAAGYQAQFVIGTATLTAGQVGLLSLPQQLILDAGGSSNGTTPYAWVQVNINGTWQTLDPSNKTYTLLTGTNLSTWLGSGLSPTQSDGVSVFKALDGGATSIYQSTNAATQNYESITAFVGGARINYVPGTVGTIGKNGTAYNSLPTPTGQPQYRVALSVGNSVSGPYSGQLCLDQIYGHDVAYRNNALYVDNILIQSGFPNPVQMIIAHPISTGWNQLVQETFGTGTNAIIALATGRVGQFRARHDAEVYEKLSSVAPATGSDQALIATASNQLGQTSGAMKLLDQLAGTYTISHHIVQVIRTNNTIDTPMTSTSIDAVTSTPKSGLQVSPQAVSYALSAAQSAQEYVALQQSGVAYPQSGATLLAVPNQTVSSVEFVSHSGSVSYDPSYTAAQVSEFNLYRTAGYDIVIPVTSSGATVGFEALNGAGTSAFVVNAASGIYKGAVDSKPTAALGALGMGGIAVEAGPTSSGLKVDPSTGEVSFAAPLISIGSADPYKLEFDLLYSSRADAQQTANDSNPGGRPEAPGVSNNFEMRAAISTDGFSLIGTDLTAAALPGVVTAYNLLASGNAIASFYAGGGTGTFPISSAFENAMTATWLTFRGTTNVVTVSQGLTTTVFNSIDYISGGTSSVYATPEPSGVTLTSENPGFYGPFDMTTVHGTKYHFNQDGQIGTITTPTGVATNFTYTGESSGKTAPVFLQVLTKVQVGTHSLSFGYNNFSPLATTGTYLLQSVTDETGRQATLPYGNCGGTISPTTSVPQLCGGTKPDWCCGNAYSYTLEYGKVGVGIGGQAIVMNTALIANAAQNGLAKTSVSYDGARTVPTAVTNANSHTTSYYIAPGRSGVTDALGHASYSVAYPQIGSGGDLLVTDSYDPLGNRTELTYNYAGQLTAKTSPDGVASSYTYDVNGNLASTTVGPPGSQITTTTQWTLTWNQPHIVTDALQHVTMYDWDPNNGTLDNIVQPPVTYQGNSVHPVTQYVYNSNGQLSFELAADNLKTCYGYDQTTFDLKSIRVDCGTASSNLNLTTSLGYDTVGNLTSVQSARGNTSTMTYDLARRVKTMLTPPIAADGGVAHTATFKYDLDGRLKETDQDANSTAPLVEQITRQTYDDVGNLISKTIPTTGSTDHTTTYSYNADEQLATTTVPICAAVSSTCPSTTNVTTQTYDGDNRPFQTFFNNILRETHLYNGDSLPSQVADGAATLNAAGVPTSTAHVISYGYDAYDRLQTTTYADGTSETLTLDNNGRITKAVNRGGLSVTYAYDALNRKTSETTQSFTAPFTTTYDEVGRPLTVTYSAGTFTYAYDTAGRQSSTTRPDGKVIGYGYDADGDTATITYPDSWVYTYGYDELDRMISVGESAPGATTPASLVKYGYDPLSRRTANTFGNGASSSYGYDAFSGLATLSHTFGPSGALKTITMTYGRDFSERRQSDTSSDPTYIWHPPAAATTTYSPNSLNQYSSINGQALTYDTNGNLLTDPTAPLSTSGTPTTYGFDQRNRLTSAVNSQHNAGYIYDPFDRRAGKVVDGVSTAFVMDGNREIADYTTSGTETARFVYGIDNAPIVEEPVNANGTPTNTWYHHLDALGTTLLITGSTGGSVLRYSTSPWGEPGFNGITGTPFRFAGMRLDPETMLYYDNARYYSPQQGRFLSPDPVGTNGGVNIYAYAGNDPLNEVDLSGLGFGEGLIEDFLNSIEDLFGGFADSNSNDGPSVGPGGSLTISGLSVGGHPFTVTMTDVNTTGAAPAPSGDDGGLIGLGGVPGGSSSGGGGGLSGIAGGALSFLASPETSTSLGSLLKQVAPRVAGVAGGAVIGTIIPSQMGMDDCGPPRCGNQFVVRGGAGAASTFASGTRLTILNGFGFSVQSEPNVSVNELARAGNFPNPTISISTTQILQAITGVKVTTGTIGYGQYHSTVNIPNPPPPGIFDRIAGAFTQAPNPYRRIEAQ